MNLPNKLTCFRIFLVPIMVVIWLLPYSYLGFSFGYLKVLHLSVPVLNLIVLLIFAVASFTDFLDGYIARRYKMITTFGKFADPIADKLLVNTTLIILLFKDMVPVVPVVLMLGRDIIVDGCRMLAAQNGVVVAAGMLGKAKTVLQMVAIILILLNNIPFEFFNLPISDLAIWAAAFVSVAGGFSYFAQLKDYIFESK